MNSQISNISKGEASEVLHVSSAKVSCDGGSEAGHPKVYLNMGAKEYAICPYCSKVFTTKKDSDLSFLNEKNN